MKQITHNEQETLAFAEKYASKLTGGEVILLSGNLGAGKSVFVRGVAQGLGIKNKITSPTFVLMKVYDVKKSKKIKYLVHVDAYRVTAQDLIAIGLEEYLNKVNSVVMIEWGEKIEKDLKRKDVWFKAISIVQAGENRIIKIK